MKPLRACPGGLPPGDPDIQGGFPLDCVREGITGCPASASAVTLLKGCAANGMLEKGKAERHDEQVQYAVHEQFQDDTAVRGSARLVSPTSIEEETFVTFIPPGARSVDFVIAFISIIGAGWRGGIP